MGFLSASEYLVEVAGDLSVLSRSQMRLFDLWFLWESNVSVSVLHRFEYKDNVLENNFIIMRMFVRIYGLAKCIADGEEKCSQLLKDLDHELSVKYQARCEEARREGGKASGPPLGTWEIPAVISDEEFYRSSTSATPPATPHQDADSQTCHDTMTLIEHNRSNI